MTALTLAANDARVHIPDALGIRRLADIRAAGSRVGRREPPRSGTIPARDPRAFPTWAISAGTARLAKVNFQPPPSVVTLARAEIAKIRG